MNNKGTAISRMNSNTYIFHLSDLHILSNADRYDEYIEVFDNAAKIIKLFSTDAKNVLNGELPRVYVVITGDIFDHKITYSADEIKCFDYLLQLLADYPVVIIPGNHDGNLNAKSRSDLISPLINICARYSDNVHFQRDHGYFIHCGLGFYHVSLYDNISEKDILDNMPADSILLYHGAAGSINMGVERANKRVTNKVVERAHLVLLGDIHDHQFLPNYPHAGYAGSLIQQNIGESPYRHGMICWNVRSRTGEFVRVQNSTAMFKVDNLRENDIDEISKCMKTYNITKINKISIVATSAQSVDNITEKLKSDLCDVISPSTQISHIYSNNCASVSTQDNMTIFVQALEKRNLRPDVYEKVIELHKKEIVENRIVKWYIKMLEWNNMFVYGDGNVIDFESIDSICGIIAANASGKSSIIDILVYAIYGETLRGNVKKIINVYKKEFWVRVTLQVSDQVYRITRNGRERNHVVCVEVYDQSMQKWTLHTGVGKKESDAFISESIGKLDEIKYSAICSDFAGDFIKEGPVGRKRIVTALFGMDKYLDLNKIYTEKKRALDKEISARLEFKPSVADPIGDLNTALEKCENMIVEINNLSSLIHSHNKKFTLLSALNDFVEKFSEDKDIDIPADFVRVRERPQKITTDQYTNANNLLSAAKEKYNTEITEQFLVLGLSSYSDAKKPSTRKKPNICSQSDANEISSRVKFLEDWIAKNPYDVAANAQNELIHLDDEVLSKIARDNKPDSSAQYLVRELELKLSQLCPELKNIVRDYDSLKKYADTRGLKSDKSFDIDFARVCEIQEQVVLYSTKITKLRSELSDVNECLSTHTDSILPDIPQTDSLREEYDKLILLPIKSIEAHIKNIEKILGDPSHDAARAKYLLKKSRVDDLRKNTNLHFDNNCESCRQNIKTLNNELNDEICLLEDAENKYLRSEFYLENYKKMINYLTMWVNYKICENARISRDEIIKELEMESKFNELSTELDNCVNTMIFNLLELHLRARENKLHIDATEAISAKLCKLAQTYKFELEEKREQLEMWNYSQIENNINECKSLQTALKVISQYQDMKNYNYTMAELEMQNKRAQNKFILESVWDLLRSHNIADLKSFLEFISQISKEFGTEEITVDTNDEFITIVKLIKSTHSQYAYKINNATISAQHQHNKLTREFGALDQKVEYLKDQVSRYEKYNDGLEDKILWRDVYAAYSSCLNNDLQMAIIAKNMNEMITRTNSYLSRLAGFSLDFDMKETMREAVSTSSGININARVGKNVIPIEYMSGYQRFIMSLTFRIVMMSLMPQSPNFIFIDEGFTQIDAPNMRKVISFIQDISPLYKFMFIITHTPDMQALITHPLGIKINDNNTGNKIVLHSNTYAGTNMSVGTNTYVGANTTLLKVEINKPVTKKARAQKSSSEQLEIEKPKEDDDFNIVQGVFVEEEKVDISKLECVNGKYTCFCGAQVKAIEGHLKTEKHKTAMLKKR